jgi:2-oxoisovalerate dehydrogenase E2 component (dihydrolipoyl transacylase)
MPSTQHFNTDEGSAMANAKQFKMPDVGEGLTEADIIVWRVSIGDTVAINDILVEVETAKAVVELPSPFAGFVASIHYEAGQTVNVGEVIIDIVDIVDDTMTEDMPANPAHFGAPELSDSEPPEEKFEVLVGYGPTRANVARRPRRSISGLTPPRGGSEQDSPNRPRSTPPVRKLAREFGIDMDSVPGTGPQGQVTRSDIVNASVLAVPTTDAPSKIGDKRTPIKGVRKVVAEAMVKSAFTAPHVTVWTTVDVTPTVKLLKKLRAQPDFADLRLSPLILVAQAVLLALKHFPAINSKWDASADEIVQFADVNLGIATATPRGLLVPNIRAAQNLSLVDLARAVSELVAEAREGKTQPDRMKDGTFTITNIGVFRVDGGTPILNPGEAAILCIGQIRRQPWEHKGKIKLRSVTTLALSFDHRLVDGELGSRVLADIAMSLEDPSPRDQDHQSRNGGN